MAADLADSPNSGLMVASCGDAHAANFGFFASPQRTLIFDLNDFDEAAWAPWEWDVKRLATSIVIGGRSTGRTAAVIEKAAAASIDAYIDALTRAVKRSPIDRYFDHYTAEERAAYEGLPANARNTVTAAIRKAERSTGERAAKRLTVTDENGRVTFVESPPRMTHLPPEIRKYLGAMLANYAESAAVDIRLMLQQYGITDIVRRVVGVGSVGTRCFLWSLQDGDSHVLILQPKQANKSVLEQYGRIRQPDVLTRNVAAHGEGWRVVSLQRVLQAFSDPFLGHLRADDADFYVRQFHDMKGGLDLEVLDDETYLHYGMLCGSVLARAHAQSPAAAQIVGYIGSGQVARTALLDWSMAYSDISGADYRAFLDQQSAKPGTAPRDDRPRAGK